jgi:hypothetical protein
VIVRIDPVLMNDGGMALDARSLDDLLRGEREAQGVAAMIRPYRGRIDEGQPVAAIHHDVAHGPPPVVDLKIMNLSGRTVGRRDLESEETARGYEHVGPLSVKVIDPPFASID